MPSHPRSAGCPSFVLAAWSAAVVCLGCGGEDAGASGSLTVLLEAESTIIDGLQSGEQIEDIQDGWAVHYDQYLLSIGDVRLSLAREPSVKERLQERFVVDLTRLAGDGTPLWTFEALDAGRWNFGYHIGDGKPLTRHQSVSKADFEQFAALGLTYSIRGVLSMEGGISCPPKGYAAPGERSQASVSPAGDPCYDNPEIRFELPAVAETGFGPCEIDGIAGVSVPAGGTGTVAATLHGDHLFFNGFPSSDEGGIVRLAQWLADCDLDLSGEVTQQELQAILLADLPQVDERYQLGSAPAPISTVWDMVVAQLMTQGHMDGEGECELEP
jgi:hypothetical protein